MKRSLLFNICLGSQVCTLICQPIHHLNMVGAGSHVQWSPPLFISLVNGQPFLAQVAGQILVPVSCHFMHDALACGL